MALLNNSTRLVTPQTQDMALALATADVDADGDVDLFVSNLGKDVLLRNDGDGHFTDVTDLSGLGDIGWGTALPFLTPILTATLTSL